MDDFFPQFDVMGLSHQHTLIAVRDILNDYTLSFNADHFPPNRHVLCQFIFFPVKVKTFYSRLEL